MMYNLCVTNIQPLSVNNIWYQMALHWHDIEQNNSKISSLQQNLRYFSSKFENWYDNSSYSCGFCTFTCRQTSSSEVEALNLSHEGWVSLMSSTSAWLKRSTFWSPIASSSSGSKGCQGATAQKFHLTSLDRSVDIEHHHFMGSAIEEGLGVTSTANEL